MAFAARGEIRWAAPAVGAFLVAIANHASAVNAYCGTSDRRVFYVEFKPGSPILGQNLRARLAAYLLPSISSDSYVASYYVLASGDIGEGADWTRASPRARSSDKKLGAARAASIESMLKSLPEALRSGSIELKVRENRQVFGQAELRANPFLNPRIRAGIVADIRARDDPSRKGQPAPLC